MKYTQGLYQLVQKCSIAKEIYSFTILCPEIVAVAKAGQFVHVLPKGYTLRRPISICGIDKNKGTLRIVFEIRGDGTGELAKINVGELVDMLAPLGNCFTINENAKNVLLIGGGIGTPPMLTLAEIYGDKATVISGFRSVSAMILQEDFKATGAKTLVCTDDGTFGHHGLVTQPFKKILTSRTIDAIYACGPTPMLQAITKIAIEKDIFCQVSLEERMGCGVGACLVCACKTRRENGEEHFAHVCKDGPIFNAKEVIW